MPKSMTCISACLIGPDPELHVIDNTVSSVRFTKLAQCGADSHDGAKSITSQMCTARIDSGVNVEHFGVITSHTTSCICSVLSCYQNLPLLCT